jgi:hypothetical protein
VVIRVRISEIVEVQTLGVAELVDFGRFFYIRIRSFGREPKLFLLFALKPFLGLFSLFLLTRAFLLTFAE